MKNYKKRFEKFEGLSNALVAHFSFRAYKQFTNDFPVPSVATEVKEKLLCKKTK